MSLIESNSYAWTCPYRSSWVADCFNKCFQDFYEKKIITELDLRQKFAAVSKRPEIMLMYNFVMDRSAIAGLCREEGINVAWCEDGFFPHYGTMHLDPLGFCWESSLSRMSFSSCTDGQRQKAHKIRKYWLERPLMTLPASIKPRFVLWPLQLIGDKVNEFDLAVQDWRDLLTHFRTCLPPEIQLVVKEHPRGEETELSGMDQFVASLPNSFLTPRDTDLHTLLHACNAVAGANSSVLYEARLMHRKPVYAYARSWFTHHDELFMPLQRKMIRSLPRLDWLESPEKMHTAWLNDYTDWFLAQLMTRQISREEATTDPQLLKQHVLKFSRKSFMEHGPSIFES
jgi:hypothetical protein